MYNATGGGQNCFLSVSHPNLRSVNAALEIGLCFFVKMKGLRKPGKVIGSPELVLQYTKSCKLS